MREMVHRCLEEDPRHASTSIDRPGAGSSEMERVSSAQAALNQTVVALKRGLPRISARSTSRNQGHRP
jgi:hypothetical protein